MTKEMLINIINSITFTTTKTTTKKGDAEITKYESKIQLPAPKPESAPKPVLVEPIGFTMVFEKNTKIKIAAVKPHNDPKCVIITYKEFSENGMLLTGQFDKYGRLVSEYATMVYDWHSTMAAFSPAFTAAGDIAREHTPEMYIPKLLGATIRAFKQHPDQFKQSIRGYNHMMEQFNAIIENIRCGMANIMKELEDEKKKNTELTTMLRQVADMLEERNEHPGVVADIRGTLGYPAEERFPHINAGTPATRHHRRSRKEAAEAAEKK